MPVCLCLLLKSTLHTHSYIYTHSLVYVNVCLFLLPSFSLPPYVFSHLSLSLCISDLSFFLSIFHSKLSAFICLPFVVSFSFNLIRLIYSIFHLNLSRLPLTFSLWLINFGLFNYYLKALEEDFICNAEGILSLHRITKSELHNLS